MPFFIAVPYFQLEHAQTDLFVMEVFSPQIVYHGLGDHIYIHYVDDLGEARL